MKNIINKLLFVTLVALILGMFSCWDESRLGNDYYFLNAYDAEDMGAPYGAVVYKSASKNVYSFEDIRIPSTVIEAKSNNKYIIVKQKTKESQIRYFIIVKTNDIVIGPMKESEFTKRKMNLNIKISF